jgi:hypothetical protein
MSYEYGNPANYTLPPAEKTTFESFVYAADDNTELPVTIDFEYILFEDENRASIEGYDYNFIDPSHKVMVDEFTDDQVRWIIEEEIMKQHTPNEISWN